VDHARRAGLTDIAFTDHDRYHEGVLFDEIEQLREKNPDIKIRAGIELDNDPHRSAAGRHWVEKHWDRLDFVLGSVHFLKDDNTMFDTVPEGSAQFENRDVDEVYADYLRRVREMAATGLVDCLAHLDLVKIHGHQPHGEIGAIFGETLDFIASKGLAIELSTAGWRKPVKEQYPSEAVIGLAKEKGIKFTTASDAHSHVQLGENYARLAEVMSALGVREISVYEKHERQTRALRQ
jgi:histidinol-phosphatase (PHP family)